MAPTRAPALADCDAFLKTFQAQYPTVTEQPTRDREAQLACYDFPAEH
ncbi:MAG: hypothetical protein ACUVQI_09815 [Thermochromatium sp.]